MDKTGKQLIRYESLSPEEAFNYVRNCPRQELLGVLISLMSIPVESFKGSEK